MTLIKTSVEIEKMKEGGQILSSILKQVTKEVRAGMSTWDLELKVRKLISDYKVEPAFLNYKGYPAAACISINDEIVHGIPSKEKIIKTGDLVSVDVGILYKKLITDASITVGVGTLSPKKSKLIKVTRSALSNAVKVAVPGNTVQDISAAIQKTIEREGFNVIRDCVGHGVGREVHEDPLVPNFVSRGHAEILKKGMTLAIEPIASLGGFKTRTRSDNWGIVTRDGSQTAHFEQTIAIKQNGAEILTPF